MSDLGKKDEPPALLSPTQLELTKTTIEAAAEITSAMVRVTNEKNPAKISEAFRVIYKTIQETVRPGAKKPST